MLPPDLSEDLCSLRPHEDRLCVTVEIPLDGGEPSFYRSVIRSRERFTYGRAEEILAGRARADADLTEALKRAEAVSTDLRDRRFARGALRVESPEIEFEFDSNGGVARAWRAEEAHSHMLVEELMILANERRGRAARRPSPRGVVPRARAAGTAGGPAAAGEARRPEGADAACAGRPLAGRRRGARGARRASSSRSTPASRGEEGGVPVARAAGAEAGPLRPAQPRPLRSRELRLLPFHVADPPLPRPRRPSRAAARTGRCQRTRYRRIWATSPSTRPSASGRRPMSSTAPMTSAWRGCSTPSSTNAAGTSRSRARSSA